jgi:hypothetical protein
MDGTIATKVMAELLNGMGDVWVSSDGKIHQ